MKKSADLASPPGAGFRYSSYGIRQNPGPAYWISVGKQMTAKFLRAVPECIWIVGNFTGHGTCLSFPVDTEDPFVTSTDVDMNEQVLDLFDENNFKVWLQVEPGNADINGLIQLVMKQYCRHPSVIGIGIDVEWYKSDGSAEGRPVSDEEARSWVKTVRSVAPHYRLFLKHWVTDWLPPTVRDGIVFVDDSQQFNDFDHMVSEFTGWGRHFAPAPVAFQFGYPADKPWWSLLVDPPGEIGKAILKNIPNSSALFWVDFSVREVFPP